MAGKKVLVIGMGKSGLAAAELLSRHGAAVTCLDEKKTPELEAAVSL
ncbi:MAG: FAD-dependent monooxygenase, partial [Verrucomicrobiae bacterium]|nr:FAD-dependent monooxygenase [Verrucomicrobiae bacterium]